MAINRHFSMALDRCGQRPRSRRLLPLPVTEHFFERGQAHRMLRGRRVLTDDVERFAVHDKHLAPARFFPSFFRLQIVHRECWLTAHPQREWTREPAGAPRLALEGAQRTTDEGVDAARRDRFVEDEHGSGGAMFLRPSSRVVRKFGSGL